MFTNKRLYKKKNLKLPKREFEYNKKDLSLLSLSQLKDLIGKYDKYTNSLNQHYEVFEKDYFLLIEDYNQLQDSYDEVCTQNKELNEQISKDKFYDSFYKAFKESMGLLLQEMGLADLTTLSDQYGKVIAEISSIEEELLKDSKSNSKTNDSNDGGTNCKDYHKDISTKISHNTKMVCNAIESLQMDYSSLINSIEGIFYRSVTKNEQNLLKKLKLEDLLLISKTKLNETVNVSAFLKKENARLINESKVLVKTKEKLLKENGDMLIQIEQVDDNSVTLQRNYDTLKEKNDINERELSGHMDLIKMLQQENRKLHEDKDKSNTFKTENEGLLAKLETIQKEHEATLSANNVMHISALRQERLKLDSTKEELEIMKAKYVKCDEMLKEANKKYEELFTKHKELDIQSKKIDPLELDSPIKFKSRTKSQVFQLQKQPVQPWTARNGISMTPKFVQSACKKNNTITQTAFFTEQEEDMKLKLIVCEHQLATERQSFQDLIIGKNEKIERLEQEAKINTTKIETLSSREQLAKEEIIKLNSELEGIKTSKKGRRSQKKTAYTNQPEPYIKKTNIFGMTIGRKNKPDTLRGLM